MQDFAQSYTSEETQPAAMTTKPGIQVTLHLRYKEVTARLFTSQAGAGP
jgi:hypothetical protein